jgi:nucleoside-diphosphate-sugar epimerase
VRAGAALAGLDSEFVKADVLDRAALRSAFAGADLVLRLAARISFASDRDASVRQVNADRVRNVAEAA